MSNKSRKPSTNLDHANGRAIIQSFFSAGVPQACIRAGITLSAQALELQIESSTSHNFQFSKEVRRRPEIFGDLNL